MRFLNHARTLILCLFLLLLAAATVSAQSTGTILGTIRDSSGAVIPGASLKITHIATETTRETATNSVGNYIAPALQPGVYRIEVEVAGFRKRVIPSVELEVDQAARIDLSLEPGSVSETIEVTAAQPLVNTESPALGQVIDNARVLNMPLNGRQFLELTLQTPGVVTGNGGPQTGSSTMFQRPGQNSSISVSGGRSQNNSFLIDGTQNTDPDVNAYVVSPSVDMIQEFKMETRNYSAEFGRSSGGQISVVTKSGTNQFHGSAYEFLRNNAVDARPFNNPGALPAFRRNQFGATFGGPIIRDRTFFFAALEGFRRVEGQSATMTVPTALQRLGDFSETRGIFDPATTVPDPADSTGKRRIRTQYANNVIPASQRNSVATRIINQFVPAPNLPGVANNYIDTRSARQRNNQGSLRLDHRLTNKDMLFGRHTLSNETSFVPSGLPGSGAYSYVRGQNFTLSETHAAGPTLVNDFKFGYNRLRLERLSENAFKRNVVGELGILGVQFGGPETWGIPSVTIPGYTTLGDDNFFLPMRLRNNAFQWLDNLTWVRGRHNLKFGGEARRSQFNIIQIFTPRGDFRFNSGITTRSAGTVTGDLTGSALAAFELGFPTQQRRTVGVNPSYLRQILYGGFVQDDWKFSSSLTVNIGVRYDFASPWADKFDRLSNVSFNGLPSINQIADQGLLGKYPVPIVIAGRDGTPHGLTTSDHNNFAPRIGVAWRPTGSSRFVVRTGYGLYYGATDGEHVGRISINAPFVVSDTQDGDNFLPLINGIGFTAPPAVGGALRQSFIGMQENLRTPYTHQWNVALQFEPMRDLAMEAAYVGSASHKLDYRDAENDGILGAGSVDARRLFQTMVLPADLPQLSVPVANRTIAASTIEIQTNRVNSNYHALQTKVERRFRNGFTMLGSYVWSKTIADGNSYRRQGTQGELAQDFLHNRERGLTGYDVRQRFVTSFLYSLPFGKGQRVGSTVSGWADKIIGQWQISGIFQAQTGFPLTVLMASATANNGRSTRANVVAGQSSALPNPSVTAFFNPAAFTPPPAGQLGNSGVMNVIGPGMHTFDGGILKTVPVREGHSLQLRVEFFNAYNHPSWGAPNASFGAAAFNTISSQSVPPRQLQFGLKYLF